MNARTVEQERASIHMELGRMYEGHDELSELLDDLLRAHARELAARIRELKATLVGKSAWSEGVDEAADEIDPEVPNA